MSGGEMHIVGTRAFLDALDRATPRGCCAARRPVALPFLRLLSSAPGKIFSDAEIFDAIYGDDPEGGPLYADRSIWVAVCLLRRKGHDIETHPWRGYSLRAQRVAA